MSSPSNIGQKKAIHILLGKAGISFIVGGQEDATGVKVTGLALVPFFIAIQQVESIALVLPVALISK